MTKLNYLIVNSTEFRRFIESKMPNDNGIISISEEIVFSEELTINYNNNPVLTSTQANSYVNGASSTNRRDSIKIIFFGPMETMSLNKFESMSSSNRVTKYWGIC